MILENVKVFSKQCDYEIVNNMRDIKEMLYSARVFLDSNTEVRGNIVNVTSHDKDSCYGNIYLNIDELPAGEYEFKSFIIEAELASCGEVYMNNANVITIGLK